VHTGRSPTAKHPNRPDQAVGFSHRDSPVSEFQ